MKTFPYLAISGSYRDVGLAIGETFRDRVSRVLNLRKAVIPLYESYKEKLYPYFTETFHRFPHLIEEMQGICDGANVDFLDYFFANTRELYDPQKIYYRDEIEKLDHCTIAVSFTQNGVIVGHNEDWAKESLADLYILKATIGDTTYLCLDYATYMTGSSASLNSWGLAQCINELPQETGVGIPKYFLSRAILETTSLDEAEKLIHSTKRASGFNHVLVTDEEVRNIEIAGKDIDVQRVHAQPYVHTNHFLSAHMRKYEQYRSNSSLARYERASALVDNNMTLEQMKTLLSDSQNTQYPICRPEETIGSVIIVPGKREMYICYGEPCKGTFQKYTL